MLLSVMASINNGSKYFFIAQVGKLFKEVNVDNFSWYIDNA